MNKDTLSLCEIDNLANMFKLKIYTKSEISEILGTNDRQGIKRKLNTLNVDYKITGRGEKAMFEIKTLPDRFRVLCTYVLGFAPQTDFKRLAIFAYMFFNDDDFKIQPFVEMAKRMGVVTDKPSENTLSKWKCKLEKNNLFMETGEVAYYSVYCGERRKIESKEYSKAWKAYFEYLEENYGKPNYHESGAFRAMFKEIGGKAVKRPLLAKNAFNQNIINALVDYAIERMELNDKTD